MATIADSVGMDWLQFFLAAGALIGGVAYAVGQFFGSKRKGEADALSVALAEVEAMKLRADRFEKELKETKHQIDRLLVENQTMREIIAAGGIDAQQLIKAIEAAFQAQTDRLLRNLETE